MDKSAKFFMFLGNLFENEDPRLMESLQIAYTACFESNVSFPGDFDLNTFKSQPSFAAKVKYTSEKLKKIGKGSSRIVYEIDADTVFKMAYNKKGIAQNNTEGDWGMHRMYPDLLPELIDRDEDGLWVIIKRGHKINPNRFKELTGLAFTEFSQVLMFELNRIRGNSRMMQTMEPPNIEIIRENDFYMQVIDFAGNFDMAAGDLVRINSYGEVGGKAMLLDPGATHSTIEEHYH